MYLCVLYVVAFFILKKLIIKDVPLNNCKLYFLTKIYASKFRHLETKSNWKDKISFK